VEVVPEVLPGNPGHVGLQKWDYGIPQSKAGQTRQAGEHRWANDQVGIALWHEGLTVMAQDDTEREIVVACVFGSPAKSEARPAHLRLWREETRQAWAQRTKRVFGRMPTLASDIPGLQAYYTRSLVSGLVCLWERSDFVTDPFVATSGMDGGAICCYPWDTGGYAPHAMSLLLGSQVRDIIDVQTSNRLMVEHSRFAPDGTPADVPYAYNMASLVSLAYAAACLHGVDPLLYAKVRDTVLAIEARLVRRGELVDCGTQHNLLEMRQTGWEHFVPSPNAERAWCFDKLAEMGAVIGDRGRTAWRDQARAIRAAIRRELWDRKAGWFRCLFPDGHAERVYSIQVFDVVQAGACTKAMAERIFSHVRDGAFLGEYGVSSISAEDRNITNSTTRTGPAAAPTVVTVRRWR